jgi:hypothetical protein
MATTTFDKRIVLEPEAADRLAAALGNPYRCPLPNLTKCKQEEEKLWKQSVCKFGKSSRNLEKNK